MDRDHHDGYLAALLDWIACAARGRDESAARAARAAGAGLLDRVTAAGTAGHILDFDDTYLPGVAHLSAATAPAAIVLGAELGASAADALSAYAAGFEAAGAISRAAHPALYDGGWHPTSVCGGAGAAVTSARLLGLDGEAERSAVALGLLRAAGLRSAFGSPGKSIQVGMAAAEGVAAARLAAAGARVDLDRVASGTAGFEEVFGAAFELGAEPAAIEQNWIKAYPCCLQTHGAIEAALLAGDRCREALELGGAIEVSVHPLSLQAAAVEVPADGLQAKFSIPYLTAHSALCGAPSVESFGSLDARALELAPAVTVGTDPELAESAAVLSLDGAVAAEVEAALGSPLRPMSHEQLAAKRRGLAGDALEGAFEDPGRPVADLLGPVGL